MQPQQVFEFDIYTDPLISDDIQGSYADVLRDAPDIFWSPLNEATRNLIGAKEITLMKRQALLINTSRGGIVDESSLADALKQGRIGGAGIDVLSVEPPREGNPLLDLHLPNLIVTPHIAWTSRQAQEILAEEVVKNIEAFAAGQRRNIVS